MLVPCVVKEAVSKFDAGRDGEREREKKKESSARRDDYSAREEGTEGEMRERRIIHGHRSIDFLPFFFFFFTTRESLGIKRFDRFSSVWKRGLEFSFLPRNLPNNIRRIKFPRFLNEFASRELVQEVREKGETAKKLREEGGDSSGQW